MFDHINKTTLPSRLKLTTVILAVAAFLSFIMPANAYASTNIFIGDSRTCGMYCALASQQELASIANKEDITAASSTGAIANTRWRARVGAQFDWFQTEGIPYVSQKIDKLASGDNVIIWMGVNDLDNVSSYVAAINNASKGWIASGLNVFVVQVSAINEKDAQTGYGEQYTSKGIVAFNSALKDRIASNIHFIPLTADDIGMTGFPTSDGLHYTDSAYKKIYSYLVNYIDEQTADQGEQEDSSDDGTEASSGAEDADETSNADGNKNAPEDETVGTQGESIGNQPEENNGLTPNQLISLVILIVVAMLFLIQSISSYLTKKELRELIKTMTLKIDALNARSEILEDMLHRHAIATGKYHTDDILDAFEDVDN